MKNKHSKPTFWSTIRDLKLYAQGEDQVLWAW